MKNLREHKRFTDFPFSPGKTPFFYGWIILFMGITGIWMSIPGQTMGISVFTDDLIRELSLSRVNLSLAYLIGTVCSALLLTPAGKKLDLYGARKMGTIVTLCLGIALLLMSNLDKAVGFIAGVTPNTFMPVFIMIIVLFFLLRFFGQGMLTLISRNMVMKWFDERRGMANAVLGVFTSFGFSLAPRFLNELVEAGGWNGAWKYLGIFLLSGGVLGFWIISRDNPFECGLKPDGNLKPGKFKKRPAGRPEKDFTLKQAVKTLPFWVFGLTLCMTSLFMTAFTFHVVSIFASAGMSRTTAVSIFLPASLISVVVNFSLSTLSDYIKLRYILMVHSASLFIAMFFLSQLNSGYFLVLFTVFYGVFGGVFNISNSVVWPRYYGTEHLGEITGMIMGFMVAGSAVGPYFYSLIMKYSGSYSSASIACMIIVLVLFILSFLVRRPVNPERQD